MKLYNKIIHGCSLFAVCGMLILGMSTCYDEKMEWKDNSRHPNFVDLPVELREQIDRYEALTAYLTRFDKNFKLGAGIDFKLYANDEAYQKIVNENFKDATAGNEMKQSSIMNSKGELDLSKVESVKGTIAQLKNAGLTTYGHVLIWHKQQQASYLNSLIAPTVIPAPPGESQLDLSALEDKSFTGWNRNNPGGITIVEGAGLNNGAAIRFEVTSAGSEWDTQLTSPEIPAVVGHAYEISFWIKSEGDGKGRMSFAGMVNNYPWVNGGALFNTNGAWTQIIYNEVWDNNAGANVPFTSVADVIKIAFDLGNVPGVYYVDLNSISVIDLNSEKPFNFVVNGDFETGELAPIVALNPNPNDDAITVTEDEKFEGQYGLKAIAGTGSDYWNLQFQIPELMLDPSKTYTMSFMIKSDGAGQGRISFPGFDNEWPWTNWDGSGAKEAFYTTSSWQPISFDFTPAYKAGVNAVKFNFDLGKIPGMTYFVDDIKIVEKKAELKSKSALRAGPIIIEKTPEEKAKIIGEAMEKWISEMVGAFKGTVHAWEVINEALNDNGTLRSSSGDDSSDEFYWQDYLEEDYAVIAFKAAAAADPNAKLFINDFNLESTNPTKLDKLIEYVRYIETQGTTVHGIGTQMHLNINWSDTTGIKKMFEKLAATGKLIKVTELDIAMSTESGHGEGPANPLSPTLAQYAKQAELYRYVADMYYRIIPVNQQYGITVWGVSDNEKEHEYWLKNDAPCIWDANYKRKHAYKGFADGLAGKDVSAEFKQDEKWDGK